MEDDKKQTIVEQPASEAINSSVFVSSPSLNYKKPKEVPIFAPTALDASIPAPAPLEATQPEQQANDLTTRLTELNNRLTGQSTYRAEQENVQGLPELQKTQTDLSSRLKALQAESLQIPLQLQQDAEGRGITAAGLRPIQDAALRRNTIQALGVSTLLEASRGNLTLAMDNVERSVAQRFDPIKEEIAAKSANLNLILNSPAYSLADKNRAQKQLAAEKQQEAQIAKSEENYKIAQAMAAAAVKLYPNDEGALMSANQVLSLDPNDPTYLQKAFGLLGGYQRDPVQLQKDLDQHLVAQGNLAKINEDLANAPLERRKMEAEIKRIESDNELAPDRKNLLKAQIANAWADAAKAESDANQTVTGGTPSTLTTGKIFTPNRKLSAQEQQLVSKTLIADKLVKHIESLYTAAVGNEYTGFGAGTGGRLKGVTRTVGIATGTNPEFTSYINFVDSNLATIAKGLKGEVGALAEGDVKRARASFPTRFSSPQEASVAFQKLKEQIQDNLSVFGDVSEESAEASDDFAAQVAGKGYNYAQMQADGYSDEEIREAVGL